MFSDSRIISLAVAVMLLPGCAMTVLEDRTDCPLELILDLSEVDAARLSGYDAEELKWGISSDDTVWTKGSLYLEALPDEYRVAARKGKIGISAGVCAVGYFTVDGGLRIPEGRDCPPVFTYRSSRYCDGEKLRDTVRLARQYARMFLIMKDRGGYIAEVTGNVCGFSGDGTLAEGPFRYSASFDSRGLSEIGIPRQKDSSMRLLLLTGSGQVARAFALGDYIVQSGYDWEAPSLEDITVEIDFTEAALSLSTPSFQRTLTLDITVPE